MRAGVAFAVLLLPLVCLCEFIPGQAANGPYLLLFPRPHHLVAPPLTDDQLVDLALTTGQAVSVADDGAVTIGYGDAGLPPAAAGTLDLTRGGLPVEQSPALDALLPAGLPRWAPPARPESPSPAGGAPQDAPAPPERPPRTA